MNHSLKSILFISPLPPPIGGIATWTQTVFANGFPDQTPISLVNTCIRGRRNIFVKAPISLTELWRTLTIFCSLLYQLILKRHKLAHLNCSLSPRGILRDVICAELVTYFKIPLVTHYHGHVPDFKGNRKLLTRLMQLSALNIFSNSISLKEAKEICSSASCITLPNFIADDIFNHPKAMPTNQRLQIMFAGGITRAKGAHEILALARRFPDCDFNLYGRLHEDMRSAMELRSDNCCLHDIVPNETLLQLMSRADVLLFPSHTEGFPLTVLEAMTMGLPVIATDVGAISDMIIHEKGGFIVKVGDEEGLANAIKTLKTNWQLRQSMGDFNQKKSFAEYRYSKVIENLHMLYGQVLCAE